MGFSKELFMQLREAEESSISSINRYLDDFWSSNSHQSVTYEEEPQEETKTIKHWIVGFFMPDGRISRRSSQSFKGFKGANQFANYCNRRNANKFYQPIPIFNEVEPVFC